MFGTAKMNAWSGLCPASTREREREAYGLLFVRREVLTGLGAGVEELGFDVLVGQQALERRDDKLANHAPRDVCSVRARLERGGSCLSEGGVGLAWEGDGEGEAVELHRLMSCTSQTKRGFERLLRANKGASHTSHSTAGPFSWMRKLMRAGVPTFTIPTHCMRNRERERERTHSP